MILLAAYKWPTLRSMVVRARVFAMTATGLGIAGRDGVAMESAHLLKDLVQIIEGVAELEQTVRQLQEKIDSQAATLQRLVPVVDRLSQSPPAPAAMSATTASSAASAPAASAAAGAPTAVGTVSAQAAVGVAGTVPAGQWQGVATWSAVKNSATCYDCGRSTPICEHALIDEHHRAGCLKNQRWYRSKSKHWRCPSCLPPTDEVPEPWPLLCAQNHGIGVGAAASSPMPPPPPPPAPWASTSAVPPAPWGSTSAAPSPLALAQPAAQTW